MDVNKTEKTNVFVKKWADFSSKYGLGYYLSNGAYGVLFNDTSKLILNSNGKDLVYIENQEEESCS